MALFLRCRLASQRQPSRARLPISSGSESTDQSGRAPTNRGDTEIDARFVASLSQSRLGRAQGLNRRMNAIDLKTHIDIMGGVARIMDTAVEFDPYR